MRRKSFHLTKKLNALGAQGLKLLVRVLLQDIHDCPSVIIIHDGTNDLTASSPLNDFIYDLTTLINQASAKFPHSKVIYSTLLPRADFPIYTIKYINQQLIASCSKLPNVSLIGHENLFAYGPELLDDDRQIKKRHIGLIATNLINAVLGKIGPTRALRPRNTFTPTQGPPSSPMGKYTSYSNAVQNNHLRVFLSRHHQLNIKRHAHHFFVKKREQGRRYTDAIANELISFFKIY